MAQDDQDRPQYTQAEIDFAARVAAANAASQAEEAARIAAGLAEAEAREERGYADLTPSQKVRVDNYILHRLDGLDTLLLDASNDARASGEIQSQDNPRREDHWRDHISVDMESYINVQRDYLATTVLDRLPEPKETGTIGQLATTETVTWLAEQSASIENILYHGLANENTAPRMVDTIYSDALKQFEKYKGDAILHDCAKATSETPIVLDELKEGMTLGDLALQTTGKCADVTSKADIGRE